MEKDDLIKDDLLGKLISKTPAEAPSDNFVSGLMAKIPGAPVTAPVQKPFFLFVKSSWQYILLAAAVVVVLLTSELPFLNFIPGKSHISDVMRNYFLSLVQSLNLSYGSMKSLSIFFLAGCAVGLLLLVDRLFRHRPKVHNTMIF